MPDSASVVFTLDELWLMRMYVRHEIASVEQWRAFPPASLELNDAIAGAILFCHNHGLKEASLLLSRGDCLILDFLIPQDARTADGQPIGKSLLLKTFEAREKISGAFPIAEEEMVLDSGELSEKMAEWEQAMNKKSRRRRGS